MLLEWLHGEIEFEFYFYIKRGDFGVYFSLPIFFRKVIVVACLLTLSAVAFNWRG